MLALTGWLGPAGKQNLDERGEQNWLSGVSKASARGKKLARALESPPPIYSVQIRCPSDLCLVTDLEKLCCRLVLELPPREVQQMAANNVIWRPQEVAVLLLYYKEKIQVSGKSLVLKEVHHEECARRINEKYGTNFTAKQVYYKYHKLKAEWKHILEAKSASGASFDDEQKKIIYDETEVVKMKAKGDKRAKYYNVPIPHYDDMEFVFTGKHATGEFCVLQAPFDRPGRHDDDFIGSGKTDREQGNGDVDPSQHYDSDTLPGSDSPSSGGPKRKSEDKQKKEKRAKFDYAAVQEVTDAMKNMSETMRFTHVTDPNEAIYKVIDDMLEYPMLVRLDLQTYLAQNGNIASMLKGRPEEAIKQWVAQWVMDRYPTGY